MTDHDDMSKVTTEGSAHVLNEVMGRLENIEAGDLPVIERVGPDGTSTRVDPTGEMIRPAPEALDDLARAAEAFATEHHAAAAAAPPSAGIEAAAPAPTEPGENVAANGGLWARVTAWFRRG